MILNYTLQLYMILHNFRRVTYMDMRNVRCMFAKTIAKIYIKIGTMLKRSNIDWFINICGTPIATVQIPKHSF
jgi:hypothetical protein